MFIASFMQLII